MQVLAWQGRHREAILVHRRMLSRGRKIPMSDCRDLVKQYGPKFPLRSGLNDGGKLAVERWRSRLRRRKLKFDIRDVIMKAYDIRAYRSYRRNAQ